MVLYLLCDGVIFVMLTLYSAKHPHHTDPKMLTVPFVVSLIPLPKQLSPSLNAVVCTELLQKAPTLLCHQGQ